MKLKNSARLDRTFNESSGENLQVIFKGESIEIIEKLKEKSGATSKKQVIIDALALYEVLDDLAKEGKLIVTTPESSEKKLVTLPHKLSVSSA